MNDVLEMLTYRRPAGSAGERAFLERFVMTLKPTPVMQSTNLVVVVPGGTGKTLFSCHTDTVHRDHAMQKVLFDANTGIAFKDDGTPLGADNTAGVWLLRMMIIQEIPGTYVFHYGEERGCVGSKQMAREWIGWLKGFDRAIAFDRKERTSIITHQGGNRCCSDEFGKAIMAQLKNYELDPTGLWTDTASYTHLISECTNLSVGYADEHGPRETLDVEHLEWLAKNVGGVKWDELPTVRDCTEKSARESGRNFGYSQPWGGQHQGEFNDRIWVQGQGWVKKEDLKALPSPQRRVQEWRDGKPVYPEAIPTDETDLGKEFIKWKAGRPKDSAADVSDFENWKNSRSSSVDDVARQAAEDAAEEQSVQNAADIDWFCEAALTEGDTFSNAEWLCKHDPGYAATLLYAFVCRELDYQTMEGLPKQFSNEALFPGEDVQDEMQDLCAGVVADAIQKQADELEKMFEKRKLPSAKELFGREL